MMLTIFLVTVLDRVGSISAAREMFYETRTAQIHQLPICDDCYNIFQLQCPLNFYGQQLNDVFVSSNGYVTGNIGLNFYYPESMSAATAWTYHRCPMIAPLFGDNMQSESHPNKVWYSETTERNLLSRARRDINHYFSGCGGGGDFYPTCLIIVTWQKMKSFCDISYVHPLRMRRCSHDDHSNGNSEHSDAVDDEENTSRPTANLENDYQLVLASAGSVTFAIFNMDHIGWTFCFDENTSGFSAGDGVTSYDLPYSGSSNISRLTSESNVDRDGRWIFRVDGDTILDPECRIAV